MIPVIAQRFVILMLSGNLNELLSDGESDETNGQKLAELTDVLQ